MTVKVRKIGNSYALTIPIDVMNKMELRDGQELSVHATSNALEYRPVHDRPTVIHWKEYESANPVIPTDISPEDYVRSLRDNDRL